MLHRTDLNNIELKNTHNLNITIAPLFIQSLKPDAETKIVVEFHQNALDGKIIPIKAKFTDLNQTIMEQNLEIIPTLED